MSEMCWIAISELSVESYAGICYFPQLLYIIELALEVTEAKNGKMPCWIYTCTLHAHTHVH